MATISGAADPATLPPLLLPSGVESHYLTSPSIDLRYHFLSSGKKGDPLVLLYHGFPETSYCWRHVLPLVAAKGYYVVAPDTRGSGRTVSLDPANSLEYTSEGWEMTQMQLTAAIRDVVVFIAALGYRSAHCMVGHDASGVLAPMVALARPDLVQRLIVASHPYTGPPVVAFDTGIKDANGTASEGAHDPWFDSKKQDVHAALAALPEPRKHYKWYYASEPAAAELHQPTSGLADFLRNYYYLKSASWPGNKPHVLKAWEADSLAQMPYYYIMPLDCGMRESCRRQLQLHGGADAKADTNPWLTEPELACIAAEWARTGFRGAINWYRISTQSRWQQDLQMLAGARLQMPTIMMLGRKDWGSFQQPGVLEKMGDTIDRYVGERWIDGAGHWMQQEQPKETAAVVLELCEMKT